MGTVTARLHDDGRVSIRNVASYRHLHNVAVDVDGLGRVVGDVAWGGNWFFLTTWSKSPDLRLVNVAALTDHAWRIRHALARSGITGAGGAEIDHIEKSRPQAVIDVVRVVSDVIGDRRRLCLARREGRQHQIVRFGIVDDCSRQARLAIGAERMALRVDQRAIVLHDAFQRFPGEIEAIEIGVTVLKFRDDAQGMGIVVEAADVLRYRIQRILSRVPKGRVTQIVG